MSYFPITCILVVYYHWCKHSIMHNTSTKYKQMHKKQYHEMTIEYLSLFVSWVYSLNFIFIIFLIHNSIASYPNAKIDKRFFKNWVLHIPHRLRDLPWIMRAWYSVASLLLLWVELLLVCALPKVLQKVINSFWHTFLEWMNPIILGGHSRWL